MVILLHLNIEILYNEITGASVVVKNVDKVLVKVQELGIMVEENMVQENEITIVEVDERLDVFLN